MLQVEVRGCGCSQRGRTVGVPMDPMNEEAELVVDARAVVGEGPTWSPQTGALFWVDIPQGNVHRFYPDTGRHTTLRLDSMVSAIVERGSGGYVIATPDGIAIIEDGREPVLVTPVESDQPRNRMNDGKVDRRGRFWVGTMSVDFEPRCGSLYRVDPDFSVHRMLGDVTTSNGISWTADDRHMYYIDTRAYSIDVFDFDLDTGSIMNRRTIVSFDQGGGRPDGMAIDVEDHLWVAMYGGGEVLRFTPDGGLAGRIPMPVSQVTSCAFGGTELRDLYITTAAQRLVQDPRDPEPLSGGLFRATPGPQGTPPTPFAG